MTDDFLTRLQTVLRPPSAPIDVDRKALWANIESLRISFPDDFLQYSLLYGSGTIRVGPYSWEIWSAARPSYPSTVANFSQIQSELRDALETHAVPLDLFPEAGGLLPFGIRSDVWFTWKTAGHPNEWKVVVLWSYEPDSYQIFDMPFSEFLFKLLTRQISVAGFHTEWNVADISFTQDVYSD